MSFSSHATNFPLIPGGGAFAQAGASATYESRASILYERGNALLALAFLHSTLGGTELRRDKASLKRCVAHFQTAAGVLHHVRLVAHPPLAPAKADELATAQSPGQDFNAALLEGAEYLMLAHAQECFWQQAVMDGYRNATIAKLAAGVSQLYDTAWNAAQRSPGAAGDAGVFSAPMLAHLRVKTLHFRAASQYRKSKDDLEGGRYGDELGRLQIAWRLVAQGQREVSRTRGPVGNVIASDLNSMAKALKDDLTRSEHDNEVIYVQHATGESALPPIDAAIMVKGVIADIIRSPLTALKQNGPALFAHLAPAGVEQAVEVYYDRIRGLLNGLDRKAAALDAHATQALTELNLPASLDALDECSTEASASVPPTLVRAAADAKAQGGAEALFQAAQDVDRMTTTDARMLEETEGLLRACVEQPAPAAGPVPDAGQEMEAANELLEQCYAFSDALTQAATSDALVKNKLGEWQPLLSVLLGGEVTMRDWLPSPPEPSGVVEGQRRELARQLRALLEDVDELADSRARVVREAHSRASTAPRTGHGSFRALALEEASKIQVANMSTAAVAATPDGGAEVDGDRVDRAQLEPLIQAQVEERFGPYQATLDKAGRALELKLGAIEVRTACAMDGQNTNEGLNQDVHAAFADTTPEQETELTEREGSLRQLHAAAAKYRELSANLAEGLHFYTEMGQSLATLHNQAQQLYAAHLGRQQAYIQAARVDEAEAEAGARVDGPVRAQTPQAAAEARALDQAQQEAHLQAELEAHMQARQPQRWGAWSGGAIHFGD